MTNEPHREKVCLWGFRPGLTQTRLYYPQKIARGLKFWSQDIESLFLCRENNDTDQLRGYHAADLRLFLALYAKTVFLMTRLDFIMADVKIQEDDKLNCYGIQKSGS